MPVEVGGLLDNLFKIGFDNKAFCGDPDLRAGIESIAKALKKATSTPLNLDDKIIDGVVISLEGLLDQFKSPVVMHADKPMTAVEAGLAVAALESSQKVVFSSAVKAKIAANPEVMKLIKKRSEKWQVKFLESSWLDTVIQWLVTYGPTIVQFLMMLLPLFI